MNVLLLGAHARRISKTILKTSDNVIYRDDDVNSETRSFWEEIDFIVSYGYLYIIKPHIINHFPEKIINLHISFLPWNRGIDPNMWSFLEDTPKGVSIHHINEKIDAGKIIAQTTVAYSENDTLRTMYARLMTKMDQLFLDYWLLIRKQRVSGFIPNNVGSYHALRDRKKVESLLYAGWDTPIQDLLGKLKK